MTATPPRTAPAAITALRAARHLDNPAFISLLDEAAVGAALDAAPTGPLHGVPFAVKDNIDVGGMPTTVACPSLRAPAVTSATAVARLAEAGAVAIGKTNMDQFATGLVGTRTPFGACHSVDSSAHVSGGSSSGSAIAVAAGVVPFALGTDTAGSGRVPAAFNGLVGLKPTRGLVSTAGVFPASPSLDCVAVFATTVSTARTVLGVIAGYDAADPWSRRAPAVPPAGVARVMSVVGVPSGPLELDPVHRAAWDAAVGVVADEVRLVRIGVEPLLTAARLLYGPFVAERYAAFGHHLDPDRPELDPVVRSIVRRGATIDAADMFRAQQRLQKLRRECETLFAGVDAILLPTTPTHPTIAQVAADPVGVNTRLGTYTNMANLLDLCVVALPIGRRRDGLAFGVQLLAPGFADEPLLDLAARLLGEPVAEPGGPAAGRTLLAVCGAHLAGEPLNPVLLRAGARLHARTRTAPGYRMIRVCGALPRPGLIDDGTGPPTGLEVELWDAPAGLVDQLAVDVLPPLRIAPLRLADGSSVPGFVAEKAAAGAAEDISAAGGWRAHLQARRDAAAH